MNQTIGIVRSRRPGRSPGDAGPLSGDDPLDGVIAHIRDTGWSLLVTYWDGGILDARKLDALPDKVDGILIDGGGIPAPLLQRLAARVPVVMIGRAPLLTVVGRPRRLLGWRACARLIECITAPGLPASVELVPGGRPAKSARPPSG